MVVPDGPWLAVVADTGSSARQQEIAVRCVHSAGVVTSFDDLRGKNRLHSLQ